MRLTLRAINCTIISDFVNLVTKVSFIKMNTRTHSSRMRSARSSSHLLGGACLPQCMLGYTPHRCGPGDIPQVETPRVWTWRPPMPNPLNFPYGCGPGDSPGQTPQLPLGCGPGDPSSPDPTSPWVWAWRLPLPQVRPLNLPPGCGPGDLQGMLGYYPLPPPPVNT